MSDVLYHHQTAVIERIIKLRAFMASIEHKAPDQKTLNDMKCLDFCLEDMMRLLQIDGDPYSTGGNPYCHAPIVLNLIDLMHSCERKWDIGETHEGLAELFDPELADHNDRIFSVIIFRINILGREYIKFLQTLVQTDNSLGDNILQKNNPHEEVETDSLLHETSSFLKGTNEYIDQGTKGETDAIRCDFYQWLRETTGGIFYHLIPSDAHNQIETLTDKIFGPISPPMMMVYDAYKWEVFLRDFLTHYAISLSQNVSWDRAHFIHRPVTEHLETMNETLNIFETHYDSLIVAVHLLTNFRKFLNSRENVTNF